MEGKTSMTICKLPSEVQSALRSGVVITSMAQCVDELVLNAIDAGATSIAVRVNFKFHKIQVVDNGCGLNSTHLDLVGTRYMTSKCHSLEDLHNRLDQFGFRGEALASLREVSGLLTLESRPKGSGITYCKVFTHGKSHKAGVSNTMRPGQGTTITVHDFMYNMPVRKQRIQSAIDLEEIKSHMECVALMHPQISLSLRNDTEGKLILHTRKWANTISTFSYLYGETVAQALVAVNSTLETGLTSYTIPSQVMTQNLYSMSKRFAFLPKGMSPVLKNTVKKPCKDSEENTLTPVSHQVLCNVITDSYSLVDELAVIKWKDVQEKKGTDCRDLVKKLLQESDNRMQFCEKEVTSACTEELPKSIVKVYNVIYPYTFSKDIFSDLKVLGQLDNKFIVTVVGPKCGKNQNVIVLFDQHAVHERIRLENLMKDYLVEGSNSEFRMVEVNPFINLKLSTTEVTILSSFQQDFEKLGLKFEVVDDTNIQITNVPTCLLAREQREIHGRGVSMLNGFLESMIREQVDSILSTRGVGIRLPAIVQSVINSEACRGAVKFGDPLYPEECAVLLKNLSRCQVPFQCAHGRPALVPIVDLQHLHIQAKVRPKPQLWKLKRRSEKLSNL